MKLNTLILLTVAVAGFSASAEIQTITLDTSAATNSDVLTLSSNSYAVLKSSLYSGGSPAPTLNFTVHGLTFSGYSLGTISTLGPLIFTGPATISLSSQGAPSIAFATFDVEPTPFPPNKTVTVGAYSGNVQVTMEMSTDLVNWTAAVNGMVYTNSPDARFFRIKMVTNATP